MLACLPALSKTHRRTLQATLSMQLPGSTPISGSGPGRNDIHDNPDASPQTFSYTRIFAGLEKFRQSRHWRQEFSPRGAGWSAARALRPDDPQPHRLNEPRARGGHWRTAPQAPEPRQRESAASARTRIAPRIREAVPPTPPWVCRVPAPPWAGCARSCTRCTTLYSPRRSSRFGRHEPLRPMDIPPAAISPIDSWSESRGAYWRGVQTA